MVSLWTALTVGGFSNPSPRPRENLLQTFEPIPSYYQFCGSLDGHIPLILELLDTYSRIYGWSQVTIGRGTTPQKLWLGGC